MEALVRQWNHMSIACRRLHCRAEGQGLIEYALIIGFVAILAISGVQVFGGGVDGLYKSIVAGMPK